MSAGLFGVVYGFVSAETESWNSPLAWGTLIAAAALLAAFVGWQSRAAHPLLPLQILGDRNRAAAYISILVAGAGMFGIFLFVTYFLQVSLAFSPIQTGLAFLPMIVMLVLAAQLSTNLLLPRFGPKIMVTIGMTLGVVGMDRCFARARRRPRFMTAAPRSATMCPSRWCPTDGARRHRTDVFRPALN